MSAFSSVPSSNSESCYKASSAVTPGLMLNKEEPQWGVVCKELRSGSRAIAFIDLLS